MEEIWKIKYRGWNHGPEVDLLKDEGGLALFLFNFLRFIIFTFSNYFTKSSSTAGHSWHQPTSAADISQHQQPTSGTSCSWWWFCYMSKYTCGQPLVLPSQCQVCPVTDDDFFKLLYPLQNCAMDSTTIVLQKKVSKNEPENIP